MMVFEEKQILDIISAALADTCFHRKKNLFYNISNGIAFCITVEHPGLYYVRYFIIPLYLPNEAITYTYGKRMNLWWDGKKGGELFFSQLSSGINNNIIPFFHRIDGLKPLLSFLQQKYTTVSAYFSCPRFRIPLLAAYTALMIHDEPAFSKAVLETRKFLSDVVSYSPNVISQIQSELDTLEKQGILSGLEIDHFYQEQIIQSINRCFPFHKLS